ncbi:MAG: phospho-sugar mutase [Clostridia bacterium]|nr:phospho-sugar mutase [Clostridia bacterium]
MSHREPYQRWLNAPQLTECQRQELASLSDEEARDRFYRTLSFGTAGLRGLMGMGLNRMNEYIVRQATDAFAQVILESGQAEKGICICYDCRINSRFFAEEAAHVMRCRGIPVWLFRDCRPTPQLSFAVRQFGAAAGINVTASHNPKEYNGFKVYGEGGAQLPTHMADKVAQKMALLDPLAPRPESDSLAPLTWLEEDFDQQYINAVLQCAIAPEHLAEDAFPIVYTPFHGVGGAIVPEVLRRAGLEHIVFVEEQMAPDGTFPTVISPNPEDPAGFALAVEYAKKHNIDFLVGTDPDSDRVGIVVRDKNGQYVPVSGNRTGSLLLHYILTAGREKGLLPEHPALVKTIVTSDLPRVIAEKNGCASFSTFTGFKYMAEKVAQLEQEGKYRYVLAYEESYGYMIGDHARDKDGVVGALLLCEMAAWYRSRGMTVLDGLEELWQTYGAYGEVTRSVMLPGEDGSVRMARIMEQLRQQPPTEWDGIPVESWVDYEPGRCYRGDTVTQLELQGSNVLEYRLATGEKLIVRPSGTEPKIKIYALMQGVTAEQADDRAAHCAKAAEDLLLRL